MDGEGRAERITGAPHGASVKGCMERQSPGTGGVGVMNSGGINGGELWDPCDGRGVGGGQDSSARGVKSISSCMLEFGGVQEPWIIDEVYTVVYPWQSTTTVTTISHAFIIITSIVLYIYIDLSHT